MPKWEAELRRQALLRNTHSSTAIEGNKLSLEQVEALSAGKDIAATKKDKLEALNYLEALKRIPELAEKGKIRSADLLNIHRIVTKEVMQNSGDSGAFRNRQVFVGSRIYDSTGFKEEVEYMPPKTEEVPMLVDEFLGWLNLDKTWGINPVLVAGIAHYEIARIHPFIDGNGRTARALATLILYLSGFDHRRIFALDDYYDRDRKSYYAALKTAQINNGDITQWLEYFTTGILSSVEEAKDAVLKVSTKRKVGQAQIALTSKQMKIVEFINVNGKVTNKDLQGLFKISAQAAHKELTKLVEMKVIKSVGEGRALHYILV
ncbi:MAG: Fic family protein [Candidatus Omnitrophota bacterium]